MNASQESKLNMYRATEKHCDDNSAILNTVPAFNTSFNNFKDKIQAILNTVRQEDLVTGGITVDKAEAKKILCQFAANIAAPVFAFAAAQNNNELKEQVNFSFSDLLKTREDQLAPRCQNILNLADDNMSSLEDYGILPANITAFQEVISDYQAKVPNPRNAAAIKTTLGKNLKDLIKEADGILKEQMDKTIIGFKTSNPDFITTYKINRVILDPVKKQTTLEGVVTNSADNSFIDAATITIEGLDTEITTDESGNYQAKPVSPGTYTVLVAKPGFIQKTKTGVVLKPGKVTTLDIALDAA